MDASESVNDLFGRRQRSGLAMPTPPRRHKRDMKSRHAAKLVSSTP
jgi:hypothetical protein